MVIDKLVLPNFKMKKEIVDDQNGCWSYCNSNRHSLLHGIISADHIDFAIVLMDFTIAQLILLSPKVHNRLHLIIFMSI